MYPMHVLSTRWQSDGCCFWTEATLDGKHWFKPDGPVMVIDSLDGRLEPFVAGQEPKRGRSDMPSLTTYAYEVLVTEKWDEKGEVVRAKTLIQNEEHLLERPTRESLLLKFAADLGEVTPAITDPESEVVVNIRPFCG